MIGIRFPWQRQETRQDAAYGDELLTAIFNQQQGSTGLVRSRIGSVAAAAGWWARAFASAKLTPGPVADAFGPALRGYTGRQLILRGEALFILDGDGGLSLTPAASWEVMGGNQPDSWIYKATIPGPTRSAVIEAPSSRVLHLMYQRSDSQPWKGIGPLADCQETHNLAQALETRLRQEVSGPVGQVIPMPTGGPVEGLEKDTNAMRGQVKLTPSTANAWDVSTQGAPRTDWRSMRIGGDSPETLPKLRMDTERSILAACGVPPTLAQPSDGTFAREALGQFLHVAVQPLADQLADLVAQT